MRRYQRGFLGLAGLQLYAMIGMAVLLAATIAGAGLSVWYLDGKVTTANEERVKAETALGKEQESRAQFQATAKSCSDKTRALYAASVANKAAAAAEKAAAARSAEAVGQSVLQMLAEQRPAGMDECTNAKRQANEAIDDRQTTPFR
jgi:hypothetical protein